ncbi:MAG: hypothetical protein DWQ40_03975 [Actinobacteria bacterium]|nr:MAG: hypothetical protein DWQ40_03975 [Actinomycetota bacterium]REK34033.1 MAG: hypothetical protein DWQ20_07095 [Actinomycetota bacterium]
MGALIDLVSGRQFLTGAAAGLAGAVLALALRRWKPDWGLIWSLATLGVLWSLGLLRGLGSVGSGRGASVSFLAVTAAALIAAVTAYGIWRSRDIETAGPAVAISIAGIWATVPDTERAAVLMGVSAVLVLAWWPLRWSKPASLGATGLALLLAWVALTDGAARDTGLIGALGSMAAITSSATLVPARRPWIWLLGHLVVVVTWSRVAGLMASPVAAIATGSIVTAAVVAALRYWVDGGVMRRETV